jgi:hypothetical protein
MSTATRTSICFPSTEIRRGWASLWRSAIAVTVAAGTVGCSTANPAPLRAVERPIDLDRFMGDWYVLGVGYTMKKPTPSGACSSSGPFALPI